LRGIWSVIGCAAAAYVLEKTSERKKGSHKRAHTAVTAASIAEMVRSATERMKVQR
jgi:hypothetical protein